MGVDGGVSGVSTRMELLRGGGRGRNDLWTARRMWRNRMRDEHDRLERSHHPMSDHHYPRQA